MSALSDTTKVSYFRRFRAWLDRGEHTTRRQFYLILMLVFAVLTLLIGGVSYLLREDKQRVQDFKEAIIRSCRDSNEVRNEVRFIIQEIKNIPFENPNIETVLKRYARLTKAQAILVDKRCTENGPQP